MKESFIDTSVKSNHVCVPGFASESSSQLRVYESVAAPIVESVMRGFNGTVMAYGQTGTGKTFTLGNLGEGEDGHSERGIMVRTVDDIFEQMKEDTEHDYHVRCVHGCFFLGLVDCTYLRCDFYTKVSVSLITTVEFLKHPQ